MMAVSTVLIGGCGEQAPVQSGPVERAGIPGSYDADTLETSLDGEEIDLLALGGEIDLLLEEDGTTSGHLFLSGGLDGQGSNVEVELIGTWSFDDETETVHFDFEQDVFLEEITFAPRHVFRGVPQQLEGTSVREDTTVRAVLDHDIAFSMD